MEKIKIYSILFIIICIPFILFGQIIEDKTKELDNFGMIGGVVSAVRKAKLSFSESGALIQVPEEGQIIKRGFLVAKQDDRKARINLAEAEANLEAAKLAIETAMHEKEKTQRLLNEKILAPIALTEADFKLQKANAELKIAKSKIIAAKLKLSQCQLVAPFKGVIVQVFGNIGEQSGPGNPVAEIVDLSKLEISVDIPLEKTKGLKPGVKTFLLIGSKKVGTARVKTILPLLDAASGLRRVIWKVTEEREMLAGRHVTLSIFK